MFIACYRILCVQKPKHRAGRPKHMRRPPFEEGVLCGEGGGKATLAANAKGKAFDLTAENAQRAKYGSKEALRGRNETLRRLDVPSSC